MYKNHTVLENVVYFAHLTVGAQNDVCWFHKNSYRNPIQKTKQQSSDIHIVTQAQIHRAQAVMTPA
jgi:hypothetical protein